MDTYDIAKKVRKKVLQMTNEAGSSHIGSIFSVVDILTVLYAKVLRFDSKNPELDSRDRFILSKGHAGAALYVILSHFGFFSENELDTYYKNGSKFSGHVSHKDISGVELSTGALGHGLGVATGMALDAKLKKKNHFVYTMLSDGECNEGAVWESALFASHHNLNNLVVIVDYNKIQCIGRVEDVLGLEPFVDKWKSFNFEVFEVDGHNHDNLEKLLLTIKKTKNNKPKCLIAHTIKGKGVSFMENDILWHFRTAKDKEYESALYELGK